MAEMFIYPGFTFQVVDGLMTNFHLPQSSLLMLVSAFAGRERVLHAYREALPERYRFYSYGDAMSIAEWRVSIGIADWGSGIGIGDCGLAAIANPQSHRQSAVPIPNPHPHPQSPLPIDIPQLAIPNRDLLYSEVPAGVAQLVRARGSYPRCPGFKSLHRHHFSSPNP